MIKLILSCYFLLSLCHAFAGEKAVQALHELHLTKSEIENVLSRFPELQEVELASESVSETESSDPESFTIKLYADYSNDVYIIQKSKAQFDIEKTYVPFGVSTRVFEGEVHGKLSETLLQDTGSEKIAAQITEAFKDDFKSTRGLKAEASYSFEVIQYFDNGQFVKFGDVIKASLVIGRANVKKILQQDLETLEWSLVPGLSVNEDKPFYAPVRSSRVSSLFQLNRRHPVTKRLQPHNGIDFVAASGTPVYPALEGEVIAVGRARAKGKYVLIQHDNGYQTTYDHLRKFKKGLHIGMRVQLDDQIGEVGRTGFATGAHLHFGVLKEGLYVNPIYLVKEYTYDQKADYETFEPLEDESISE